MTIFTNNTQKAFAALLQILFAPLFAVGDAI
jgi:hypothetical protein